MTNAKHEIQSLLQKMPDDWTAEDFQYHLYVIEKLNIGITRAKTEGTVPQEEVEKRLSKWISK